MATISTKEVKTRKHVLSLDNEELGILMYLLADTDEGREEAMKSKKYRPLGLVIEDAWEELECRD